VDKLDMSTLLLPAVVPAIYAYPVSFYSGEEEVGSLFAKYGE